MPLPECRTKIVATLGPACFDPAIVREMILSGMDVARLNLSHGNEETHRRIIETVRREAAAVGRRVTILADLPGPKIRIGRIEPDPLYLDPGTDFTLTTEPGVGDAKCAYVSFDLLPQAVRPGDPVYLNDGLILLRVEAVESHAVRCRVEAGGELRSGKGLNLPGLRLSVPAFTERDRELLKFVLREDVEAVSQSFVESARDLQDVRKAAAAAGKRPFVIAKIERAAALERLDEIIEAADGVMVARGDLGVETPIERIALVQKDLMRRCNLRGRPVIAATQLLESMTTSRTPTRAEATDVANAVLDGADCLMLSGETAVGGYPVEAVRMLARIASAIEELRPGTEVRETLMRRGTGMETPICDLVAASVAAMVDRCEPAAIVVPSRSGATARSIARFRPKPWVIAISQSEMTCAGLHFSYGIHAIHEPEEILDWSAYIRTRLRGSLVDGDLFMLAAGPTPSRPDANIRVELVDLSRPGESVRHGKG